MIVIGRSMQKPGESKLALATNTEGALMHFGKGRLHVFAVQQPVPEPAPLELWLDLDEVEPLLIARGDSSIVRQQKERAVHHIVHYGRHTAVVYERSLHNSMED